MSEYIELEVMEASHFKRLKSILKGYPLWTEFLEGVKGIGPAMGGVILSEIDISQAQYPSSLWKYAGLDVAKDGRGRSRKKEHLVEKGYTDADGKPCTTVGITFNPFLKTKLMGVLGGSFLKAKSPYTEVYYGYRTRLENHPEHQEKTKGHRHNMAMRYMIKRLLADLHPVQHLY